MSEIAKMLGQTIDLRGPRWATQSLGSVARMTGTLPGTRPIDGCTAIVVGAGTSIDEIGPWLATWQSNGAVVVSTNTAVGACLMHGCTPDIVCFLETDPNVAHHLGTMHAASSPGSCVVLHPYCADETWAAVQAAGFSPMLSAHREPAIAPLMMSLGVRPLWYHGSVAIMCIAVARHLGCSRILLAGQDACYSERRLYARGKPFEDLRPQVEQAADGSHWLITTSTHDVPSKRRRPAEALWARSNEGKEVLTDEGLRDLRAITSLARRRAARSQRLRATLSPWTAFRSSSRAQCLSSAAGASR